jgi:hypothetical protein
VADGPGGSPPAACVHHGAQPGLTAQVRRGMDESSGSRTSIRRGGRKNSAGPGCCRRPRHQAFGSASGRIAFRILRIGVRIDAFHEPGLIRFYAPGVAAVHCDWDMANTIDYDGHSIIPLRQYVPVLIVTKSSGKWWIADYHNVLIQPLPPGAAEKIRGPVKP